MSTFTNPATLLHPKITITKNHHTQFRTLPKIQANLSADEDKFSCRRKLVTTFLATSLGLGLQSTPLVLAENWGVRSFLIEHFFEPGLSPEDAVARIRQTADGLHSIKEMLETMSWRYVLFYIRLKSAYLKQDMKNALSRVPESRKEAFVKTANELTDNMAEFDYYIRTPKVYESRVFYEKTLKSIDELVALLA
ncbi:photosynthetic NDH subunit of lumenal location 2, chloroplastic isoform X1 [Nicotiana tomentosiformis]|uniref:photosynthetic NDH subunit of lumenal location 2, chloroplastic isoform X1 n=1 Tax=Nicotiana tomentosiformis TaxID=4098 RepID=UPI00051ABCA8|nr:photosynthetic NDH subunit of lumenal location 2, chloroplastic isoform X1 [Nicotiana tomentosiformis]